MQDSPTHTPKTKQTKNEQTKNRPAARRVIGDAPIAPKCNFCNKKVHFYHKKTICGEIANSENDITKVNTKTVTDDLSIGFRGAWHRKDVLGKDELEENQSK